MLLFTFFLQLKYKSYTDNFKVLCTYLHYILYYRRNMQLSLCSNNKHDISDINVTSSFILLCIIFDRSHFWWFQRHATLQLVFFNVNIISTFSFFLKSIDSSFKIDRSSVLPGKYFILFWGLHRKTSSRWVRLKRKCPDPRFLFRAMRPALARTPSMTATPKKFLTHGAIRKNRESSALRTSLQRPFGFETE